MIYHYIYIETMADSSLCTCVNFHYYLQRFNVAEERRISQEIELQSYLNSLIIDEKKR